MKNLFKSLILLILEMLVQRKFWKGSWVPEWLNSDFEQGTGRKVERGQAIPLNYFKDANKELTITQKLVWENPAHTAKAKSVCVCKYKYWPGKNRKCLMLNLSTHYFCWFEAKAISWCKLSDHRQPTFP